MSQLVGPLSHQPPRLQQQIIQTQKNLQTKPPDAKPPPKSVLLFPSDKNGCGFYRTFIPFNYLVSKYEYDCPSLFSFIFDLNYITRASWLRFQRQVTDAQKKVIFEYKKVIKKSGSNCKIAYELDDLVHGIEPSNILAWQFYTDKRKSNLIDIFRACDTVTFSTQFLKDYYEDKFEIDNSVVIPNYLPKYLWGNCGQRNKYGKGKKPRILWAGSASHVGKGGDLEFLVPLIKKTKKEFEWVFFGVIPPELNKSEFEFHNWSDFFSYPQALDSIDADIGICPIKDNVFNYGKSDLKLLEYSSLGLPGLFSSIGEGMGPYDMIEGINTKENDVDVWYQSIKEMIKDHDLRNNYLTAGKRELNKRWLEDENNIKKYLDVYN